MFETDCCSEEQIQNTQVFRDVYATGIAIGYSPDDAYTEAYAASMAFIDCIRHAI